MGERFFFYWLTRGRSFTASTHYQQFLSSTPVEWTPTKPQGKDTDVLNIDDLFGFTPANGCFCLGCLHFTFASPATPSKLTYISCRIPGCTWTYDYPVLSWSVDPLFFKEYVVTHEESHFSSRTKVQGSKTTFTCKQEHCKFTTKRHSDIKRHYSSKHCRNAKKFPCHVIGCKFSGDNGFARKDKLKDHVKKGHRNMFAVGRPVQNIKPKASVTKNGSGA